MFTLAQDIFTVSRLLAVNDFTPSKKVNGLFSFMVNRVIANPNLHQEFPYRYCKKSLRAQASKGEYHLEKYEAQKIICSQNPQQTMETFLYYHHYRTLVEREMRLFQSLTKRLPSHVVFLGSGPLPLTAILLAQNFGVQVTLVDRDDEAIALSGKVIDALQLSSYIHAVKADAMNYADYRGVDMVLVAGLIEKSQAGEAELYRQLFQSISLETIVLIRSAKDARTLLYDEVSTEVDAYFYRLAEEHPSDFILNSMILCQKKP